MIDKIAFSLPGSTTPELENAEVGFHGGIKGKYSNMSISVFPEKRIYCRGSLAKFLHGQNVTSLTREEFRRSLEKLEEESGWNLHNAEIRQLEFGFTTPVNHPVGQYLGLIGRRPRSKRVVWENGMIQCIENSTKSHSFILYDKNAESRRNIPLLFQGMNLLRLELKLKKSVKKYLGSVSPWDLLEKDKYRSLNELFMDYYFSIPKLNQPVLDVTEKLTPKDFLKILEVVGIHSLGPELWRIIAILSESGKLSRVDRLRECLQRLNTNSKFTEPDELIKELDSKVIAQTMLME
ncbi:MAG: hypothetical protein MI717_00670 [Spirochaetales bacterium]|nr:hypothetical protein [Spirochaetales bacterium]